MYNIDVHTVHVHRYTVYVHRLSIIGIRLMSIDFRDPMGLDKRLMYMFIDIFIREYI